MKLEESILNDLKSLKSQYEAELTFLHNRSMHKFDSTVLPQVIQDFIKLAVAKTPSFSNISALAVTNFVLSHTFGQLRPVINDPIYSDDDIGVNTYSIVLNKSGGGKDSTYQAITKATTKAMEYIDNQAAIQADEKAKRQYIKEMSRNNPEFDETSVTIEDYRDYIAKPETKITSLSSTRGGLTTSLNRMAKTDYHIKSLFASELGLAIQANSGIVDVLELFSILYDMGQSVAPEFKTEESKEESINGMFPNLLGISSPAPFYTEGNVRKLLIPMLMTSLARRTSIVFSTASEEFENKYVPKSPAEKRQIQADQRVVLIEYTNRLNQQMLDAVKQLHIDPVIMFDEEAQVIYDDYKSYTATASEILLLQNGDSVEGIEMSGRAFKMGRIAATWAIAQGKSRIDAHTLQAAIYFCDYTAQHLLRFAETLDMKDYERFIQDWQQGFFNNVLPIDQAITKGYVNVKQVNTQSLNNFLKPVNSKLEGIATVSYNDKSNAFIFVPVIKDLSNIYSYRACGGHVATKPIVNVASDKPLEALGMLLTVDSSFNPFVNDEAKFITLSVNKSFLSMQMINKYLINTQHFIATSTDPDDKHAYTLILPLNTYISKQDYKHIAMSVANQLMLKIAPEHCEWDCISHGYTNAIMLTHDAGAKPFDVSGILGNIASGGDIPLLATKAEKKPSPAAISKYVDNLMDNKQTIIDVLDASSTPLLVLASIVYDMHANWLDNQKIVDIVNSINASLQISIPEAVKTEYLIEPFVNL